MKHKLHNYFINKLFTLPTTMLQISTNEQRCKNLHKLNFSPWIINCHIKNNNKKVKERKNKIKIISFFHSNLKKNARKENFFFLLLYVDSDVGDERRKKLKRKEKEMVLYALHRVLRARRKVQQPSMANSEISDLILYI